MENARRTRKNLEKEQFCRAEANNDDVRDPPQTELQEEWQVEEDLLLRIREFSNCFISFLPAELAWNPIEADGYTFVNYLCVSGPFKGRGYARLFGDCIRKSRKQGRKGVCILSSAKKKPFLADPKYLKRLGFSVCDESDCGIQFWALPFEPNAEQPRFRDCAKRPHADAGGLGPLLYEQGSYSAKNVTIFEQTAGRLGIPFQTIRLESRVEARFAPTPITSFALFYQHKFLTGEQMNAKRFKKLASKLVAGK